MMARKILTANLGGSNMESDRQARNSHSGNPKKKDAKLQMMPDVIRPAEMRRGRRPATQPDLYLGGMARRLGVTPGWLSKLFRGKGTPSAKLLMQLSEVLGKSMEETMAMLEAERQKLERPAGTGRGRGVRTR